MGTIIGDSIRTTIGNPFPHFIVSTRESSSGFKAWGQGFPALGL